MTDISAPSRRRIVFLGLVSAIIPAGAFRCFAPSFSPYAILHTGSSAYRRSTSLRMSDSPSMAGKIVYQRFLYKLGPISDTPETPYTIEERVRFQVGEDGRELNLIGHKTFLLRQGPPDDGAEPPDLRRPDGAAKAFQRVGKVVHRLSLHEMGESEHTPESYAAELGGTVWDSSVASALFFASQPDLMRGKVLELGSGVGFGGLMSCIAAGVTHPKPAYDISPEQADVEEPDAEKDDGDVLPHKEKAPYPPHLEKLTLADFNEEVLQCTFQNTRNSGLPASKVGLAELDWSMPVPKHMKNQYDLIIGNDIAYQFPDVKHISRLVAYSLKASPYVGQVSDKLDGGHFVHIGPHNRDTISHLRKKLRNGYKMDLDVGYLELRRYDLAPMILDSIHDEAAAEDTLVGEEQKGFVEFQNQSNQKFSSFVATHHMDYDGYNGEFFFPAETGLEGSEVPSRWVGTGGVERDENFGKADDLEGGSWTLD